MMHQLVLDADHLAVQRSLSLMVLEKIFANISNNEHIPHVAIAGVFRCPVNPDRVIINCSVILMNRLARGQVFLLRLVQRFLLDLLAGIQASGVCRISLMLVIVREVLFLFIRVDICYFQDVVMLPGDISIVRLEMWIFSLAL